jgi:hypothetical protein
MQPMTIFAIAACLLVAGLVYVVLKVQHFGESQQSNDKLLKAQTEIAQVKKTLKGLTCYRDFLEAGKQALSEQLKPPIAKLTRQYVHMETIARDKFKLVEDVTVVINYDVEFSFAMDMSAAGLDVTDADNGIGLKISRPALTGEPQIKTVATKVLSTIAVADEKPLLDHAHAKFVQLVRHYGSVMSTEESLRALCKIKALECLRDALIRQSGVKQVPAIFVDFK